MLESAVGPGSLIYGLDYYHDDVDSSGYQSNLIGGPLTEVLPIADDSDYDLFGAYASICGNLLSASKSPAVPATPMRKRPWAVMPAAVGSRTWAMRITGSTVPARMKPGINGIFGARATW